MDFKFPEDKKYFANIFCGGDIQKLEEGFKDLFDFRSPDIKRKEFNLLRSSLFSTVFKKAKGICQICKLEKGIEADHIIPLSSNNLNKKLRRMQPSIKVGKLKKVPAESYGSNKLDNLQLVCKSCNRKKWHNL